MSNKNKSSRKKGFTLVELLAVIVILAIILVIAVPKIMSVIEDSKKATLESTAKMIASSAEKAKIQNAILGKDETITCKGITNINDVDYESCSIEFVDNTAKVTIAGSGKFEGLYVCGGDKTSATAKKEKCPLVCKNNEVEIIKSVNAITPYEVKDYDSCVGYMKPKIVDEWGNSQDDLESFCSGDITWDWTFSQNIQDMINYGDYTEKELVVNNVIKGTITKECIKATKEACFEFDSNTGTILRYYTHENNDESQPVCPKDVVIPSKINNVLVSKIGNCSFIDNPSIGIDGEYLCGYYDSGLGITSVIMSNNIEEIGSFAFGANQIASVKFPSSLIKIGSGAFYHNNISGELDLSNINLEIIEGLDDSTEMRYGAFHENQITSVKLPQNIIKVGRYAFSDNPLSNVYLGNQNIIIGSYAFGDPNTITTHNLPDCYVDDRRCN